MSLSLHIAHRVQRKQTITAISVLFASLASIFFFYAFVAQGSHKILTMNFLFTISIMAASMTIITGKTPRAVPYSVGFFAVLCLWIHYLTGLQLFLLFKIMAIVFIFCLAIRRLVLYVFNSDRIDANHIFAAANVYLLLGVLWAILYGGIHSVDSASFENDSSISKHGQVHWSDFLYYSFVTLTTLGYGDIIPSTPTAEMLAVVEAISGVLFVGITISSLIAGRANLGDRI